jgi:hypothetical protein
LGRSPIGLETSENMWLGNYNFGKKCWRIELFENMALGNCKFEKYVQTFENM